MTTNCCHVPVVARERQQGPGRGKQLGIYQPSNRREITEILIGAAESSAGDGGEEERHTRDTRTLLFHWGSAGDRHNPSSYDWCRPRVR